MALLYQLWGYSRTRPFRLLSLIPQISPESGSNRRGKPGVKGSTNNFYLREQPVNQFLPAVLSLALPQWPRHPDFQDSSLAPARSKTIIGLSACAKV